VQTPKLALVSFVGSLGALSFGVSSQWHVRPAASLLTWDIKQYDNGWWGFILGAGYFNDQYGSTPVLSATGQVTSYTLSASEQSAGTGLGTAGGCHRTIYHSARY
jgi:hypothetical protein